MVGLGAAGIMEIWYGPGHDFEMSGTMTAFQ
jgi:hypothetical protein